MVRYEVVLIEIAGIVVAEIVKGVATGLHPSTLRIANAVERLVNIAMAFVPVFMDKMAAA